MVPRIAAPACREPGLYPAPPPRASNRIRPSARPGSPVLGKAVPQGEGATVSCPPRHQGLDRGLHWGGAPRQPPSSLCSLDTQGPLCRDAAQRGAPVTAQDTRPAASARPSTNLAPSTRLGQTKWCPAPAPDSCQGRVPRPQVDDSPGRRPSQDFRRSCPKAPDAPPQASSPHFPRGSRAPSRPLAGCRLGLGSLLSTGKCRSGEGRPQTPTLLPHLTTGEDIRQPGQSQIGGCTCRIPLDISVFRLFPAGEPRTGEGAGAHLGPAHAGTLPGRSQRQGLPAGV